MAVIDWQSNRVQRICTSAAIVAVLGGMFGLRFLTIWIFDIFIVFLALVAAWEVHKAKTTPQAPTKKAKSKKDKEEAKEHTRIISTALGAVVSYYLFAYIVIAYTIFVLGRIAEFKFYLHIVMQIVIILVFALYTMFMSYMDKGFIKECKLKKQDPWKTAAMSGWEFIKIVIYPCLLLFALIPINHIGEFVYIEPFLAADPVPVPMLSTLVLLLVFMISCFTDTFAYMVGMVMRGPKLLPKKLSYISPKKTISGAVGGIFGGMVGALLALLIVVRDGSNLQILLDEKIGDSLTVQLVFMAIGAAGAIISTIGDLYASWLKRRTGIKDFGNYLPGHGGAMDRLDGIAFNAFFLWFLFMMVIFV